MPYYHLFVSHAWDYNERYNTVIDWLDQHLSYKNYSVPEHDPLDAKNTEKLKAALTEQIKHANIVIIISGMYYSHSEWMSYELTEAIRMEKTIIALKPRGNKRMPKEVLFVADEQVNWNAQSLIDAIRKH